MTRPSLTESGIRNHGSREINSILERRRTASGIALAVLCKLDEHDQFTPTDPALSRASIVYRRRA
jgi:hypothetical protein